MWIEELSVQSDHIHLVMTIPPKYAVSTVIGRMKQYTSKMLRIQFEYLGRYRDGMWSIGYFVSSVGLNEDMIKRYVKHQNEQDKGQAVSLYRELDTTGYTRSTHSTKAFMEDAKQVQMDYAKGLS